MKTTGQLGVDRPGPRDVAGNPSLAGYRAREAVFRASRVLPSSR